jgi:hypothetical protein
VVVFRAPPAFADYVESSKANEDLIKRIGVLLHLWMHAIETERPFLELRASAAVVSR